MHKLTDRAIKAASPREKAFRLSDGGGLLLEVRPNGKRSWLFRSTRGTRRDMGLGAYPAVSLAAARLKAREAHQHVLSGLDPIATRDAALRDAGQRQREAEAQRARTFRDAAEALVAAQAPGWSSGKTLASWRLTLDRHAYPTLGTVPVSEVSREHVLSVLTPVWMALPATARKLQRRLAMVLDYAAAHGWRASDNPALGRLLRLTKALPAQPPSRQQPSLPWQRVPAFLAALERMEGVAPLALRFAVLTGVRSAEARFARWNELDLAAGVWTLPPQRMKGGGRQDREAHRVPLSAAMLAVLARAAALRVAQDVPVEALAPRVPLLRDALVFPSPSGRALSDMALSACIIRMNAARPAGSALPWLDADGRPAVPHGFRRSFRTWVDDTCPGAGEAAEKALAHDEANETKASYRGSDMLEQRRPLMARWGDHCTGGPTARQRRRHAATAR